METQKLKTIFLVSLRPKILAFLALSPLLDSFTPFFSLIASLISV
jgi:hypothetical protein